MECEDIDSKVELLQLLAARLERLSVDSIWARRASGLRGSVLKCLEEIDTGQEVEAARLELLIEKGFEMLRRAAQEIPDLEALRKRLFAGPSSTDGDASRS